MKWYKVFDGHKASLFEQDAEVYAKNAADAVRIYMKNQNIVGRIVRSSDRDVRFGATPFRLENGSKYRDGNRSWFKLYPIISISMPKP